MSSITTAIYALTPQGAALGNTLTGPLHGILYLPAALAAAEGASGFVDFGLLMQETFQKYRRHVFITAAGIAVRVIAPHLEGKTSDPAVVVMDQKGRFVISLLSGHIGGANNLAKEVAALTGGQSVITTATDAEGLPSLDVLALDRGLAIHNPKAVTAINATLLTGIPVAVYDPRNRLGLRNSSWEKYFTFLSAIPEEEADLADFAVPIVEVTCKSRGGSLKHLVLHPGALHAGIGCRKGVRSEDIVDFVQQTLEKTGFSVASLASLASIDAKKNEEGLLTAAAWLGVPIHFFPAAELVRMPVTDPSPKALEQFGIEGVSEPSALLAAGKHSVLVLPKQKGENVTLALAESVFHA
jgi:cobalamin biosynthesis protein CbiG